LIVVQGQISATSTITLSFLKYDEQKANSPSWASRRKTNFQGYYTSLNPLHPISCQFYNSATPAANPPSMPAPTPTTLCAPDLPVAEAAEFVADETRELTDDSADDRAFVPLPEAAVGAEVPEEEAADVELAPAPVEHVTAEGRFVTPAVPQKVRAKSVAAF
jgi:hypothetical protein